MIVNSVLSIKQTVYDWFIALISPLINIIVNQMIIKTDENYFLKYSILTVFGRKYIYYFSQNKNHWTFMKTYNPSEMLAILWYYAIKMFGAHWGVQQRASSATVYLFSVQVIQDFAFRPYNTSNTKK